MRLSRFSVLCLSISSLHSQVITNLTNVPTIMSKPVQSQQSPVKGAALPSPAAANDVLFAAIKSNDKAQLIAALKAGADVMSKDAEGNTTLNVALNGIGGNPSLAIIPVLLEAGADSNAVDKDGNPPLVKAAQSSEPFKIFRMMLATKYNVNTTALDANGNTALMILLKKINDGDKVTDLVKWANAASLLLDHDNSSIDIPNNNAETPLHLAVSGQSWEWNGLGEKIMAKHPNVNTQDRDGDTPLIKAIKTNNIGVIPSLVKEQSINLDIPEKTGKTALALAQNAELSGKNHACSNVMVQLLLSAGAKVPDLSSEILQAATFKNGKKAVEQLVNQGVSVNTKDSEGNTPLILAAQAGNDEVVSYLLEVQGQYHVQQAPRLFDPAQLKGSICYTYSAEQFAEIDSIDPTIKNNAGNDALAVAKGATKNLIQNYFDTKNQ